MARLGNLFKNDPKAGPRRTRRGRAILEKICSMRRFGDVSRGYNAMTLETKAFSSLLGAISRVK